MSKISVYSLAPLSGDKETSSIRFISAMKWKNFMISELIQMHNKYPQKASLLEDLSTIVCNISQEKFVQATLSIRPFKPEFIETSPILNNIQQSTMTETLTKIVSDKCIKKKKEDVAYQCFVTEKTLKKLLNQKNHPYRFLIKNFCYLLELKAKNKDSKNQSLDNIKEEIRIDFKILEEFLIRVSEPYERLFQCSVEQKVFYNKKLEKFISQYVKQHDVINQSMGKILRHHCRISKQQKKNQIQNFCDPQKFDIPADFKIDGCYVRSMNCLMEMTTISQPKEVLNKLTEFRYNILKDIDTFYCQVEGEPRTLQLNAEYQIQILLFIVSKLKNWTCQIYASLVFLEIIFGEEEIASKFDEASFMYSQLSLIFAILHF